MKKINRYELAYNIMFKLIDVATSNKNIGLAAMADVEFFKFACEKKDLLPDGFTWDEFSIDIENMRERFAVINYSFPEPQVQSDAKFGAIIIDKEANSMCYYTLDKGTRNNQWLLCFNTPDEHSPIGVYQINKPTKKKWNEILSGAVMFYQFKLTDAVFKRPKGYQRLNNAEDDPEDCINYCMKTNQTRALVQGFSIDSNDALDFLHPETTIDRMHELMDKNQALIEVSAGTTHQDYRYIYSIIKTMFPDDKGVKYSVLLQIFYSDIVLNIRGFFSEQGTTGVRDTCIFDSMANESDSCDKVMSSWCRDPYDSELKADYLMNLSEQEKFDSLFPEHALSQCRLFIRQTIGKRVDATADSVYRMTSISEYAANVGKNTTKDLTLEDLIKWVECDHLNARSKLSVQLLNTEKKYAKSAIEEQRKVFTDNLLKAIIKNKTFIFKINPEHVKSGENGNPSFELSATKAERNYECYVE